MEKQDRTVVAGFVLALLGVSYLVAVQTFVTEYRLVAGLAYLVCASLLLWRVSR
jgi:hypothetical protein